MNENGAKAFENQKIMWAKAANGALHPELPDETPKAVLRTGKEWNVPQHNFKE